MAGKRTRRRLLWAGALAVAALAGLHFVNHQRMAADRMQAGADRILDQARAVRTQARPEYQELALAGLGANPRNGPFVRLDTALGQAELTEAPAEAGTGGFVEALELDGPPGSDLKAAKGSMGTTVSDGLLTVVTDGADYLVNGRPLAVPRDEVGDIVIRAKADQGSYMRLAWVGEDGPDAVDANQASLWLNRIDVRFQDRSDFHTYVVNARNVLKRGLAAGEKLTRLLLQPSDVAGAKVEIDFIRFVPKAAVYAAQPHGIGDETIGNELRQMLFMRPDQSLGFAVEVPAQAPRLDFGMGTLVAGAHLRFEVLVETADGVVTRIHDATLTQADHWIDARVDLAPWAGQERAHAQGHRGR